MERIKVGGIFFFFSRLQDRNKLEPAKEDIGDDNVAGGAASGQSHVKQHFHRWDSRLQAGNGKVARCPEMTAGFDFPQSHNLILLVQVASSDGADCRDKTMFQGEYAM